MTTLRIGCSGWSYKDWRGPFYPDDIPQKRWLEYYATRFDTAEINASFYRLPTDNAVATWAATVPPGFVFAWKASRYITHNKKLKDCEESVPLVFGRMTALGDIGPVLFQLPPQLRRNDERLAGFIRLLPAGYRCAFEFRHASWYDETVFEILRGANLSLVISDHHDAPSPWLATADFVYVRGHGPGGRYFGRYGEDDLKAWAGHVAGWRGEGRDVFCYFDNDIKSAAPQDAAVLLALTREKRSHIAGMSL